MKEFTFHFTGNGMDFKKSFAAEDHSTAWLLAGNYVGKILGCPPCKVELIQD
jgi:hypothetical protein